jgi:CheY-like chemotaxis protein
MTIVSAASLSGVMAEATPGVRQSQFETIINVQAQPLPSAEEARCGGDGAVTSFGRRVLLVGDDAVVSLDLQRILRDAGYRVVGPASSISIAERLAGRGRIDCAILDIDRWPARAFAIADRLAVLGIPLVLMSANETEQLPRRFARVPLVRKPEAARCLVDAIEQAIAVSREGSGEELEPPPYTFDTRPPMPWPRVLPGL